MGSQGGTGKAEDAKTAGRRNYPEAVPKEMAARKGANQVEGRTIGAWGKDRKARGKACPVAYLATAAEITAIAGLT